MHRTIVIAVVLLAMAGFTFGAEIPAHNIYGNYVEARTADVYTGPCFANAEVGLVGQLAVFGWKVTKGSWQGVDLDGMSVVGVVRAHHMVGDLLQDVVRVDYQPIELTFADDDIHSMKANLTAGNLAKISTRALSEGDHICHNEEVWYRPLTKLDHAMPAYALANQFQGQGLDTTWSNPDKRSAFVGTFVTESE